MKRTQILTALLVLVVLISCAPTKSEIAPSPNPSLSPTSVLQPFFTQTSTASPIFQTLTTTTPIPAPALSPVPTQPDEQVYIDPNGWYSVAFPAKWKKSESSSYVGSDGFFETGYLPDLGFVPDKLTVCEWLANIQTKNLYTISLTETYRCRLFSRPGIFPAIAWEIIENPFADLTHRFFYIKADNAHFARVASTFSWLRLVDEKAEPDFSKAALRSEDIAFWNNTSAIPSNFSLKEYALPAEHQGEDPSQKIFLDFVPPELLPTRLPGNGTIWHSPTLESVNQSIAKYGYGLRQADTGFYDLYQKGKLILQNIYPLPEIYLFQTGAGNNLIFFAQTRIDPKKSIGTVGNEVSYLVQNEKISVWEKAVLNPMISGWTPIWVGNKPLFLGLGGGVTLQVWDTQRELVSSFTTYNGASVPLKAIEGIKGDFDNGVTIGDPYSLNEKETEFFRKGKVVTIHEPRSGFYWLYYWFNLANAADLRNKLANMPGVSETVELEKLAGELSIRLFPYRDDGKYSINDSHFTTGTLSGPDLLRVDLPIDYLQKNPHGNNKYYLQIMDGTKKIIKEEYFLFIPYAP